MRMKLCVLNTLILLSASLNNISAQAAKGIGALNEANNALKSYLDPVINIFYAICAIIAIIGAVKVFSKWSGGDPDTTKFAATWFGSLVFAVIAVTAIKAFFL